VSERPVFTYQTRLDLTEEQEAVLDQYAQLYGKVERTLFAALIAGEKTKNELKSEYINKFGITARQFNAIRIGLEGKVRSIKQARAQQIKDLVTRIGKARRLVRNLSRKAADSSQLHQKKRRLARLEAHLSRLKQDHAEGKVRLCFGSKKLFHAQFNLAANGYADHAQWRRQWEKQRSNQFFVLGSGDETAGNQSCQACSQEDGRLKLVLRLPNCVAATAGVDKRPHLEIPDVYFAYGHNAIETALASGKIIPVTTSTGNQQRKRIGDAISYRFVRDAKGWRVFVSVEAQAVPVVSNAELGAIGVDLNVDHLATAETDRFGNLTGTGRIDLVTYGKSHNQTKAVVGDAAARLAAQARQAAKPVAVEQLDFARRKAELESVGHARARMLSCFVYTMMLTAIKSACFRTGVKVIFVNPAYTSVIGAVNHAQKLGISIHQGAAYAIARRALSFGERPTGRAAFVPTRNGGHVTLTLPERNRARHVWSFWADVRRKVKAAHAAHRRCGGTKRPPPPLSQLLPAVGATWQSTVQPRGANRSQHCSGSVVDNLPD